MAEKNGNNKAYQGNILGSPLFRRFLIPLVITGLAFTVSVYVFSVPYLKNLVYSMEEKAAKTNLNNIYELVRANYLSIEAYKESVLSAHKRQLKNITLFQEVYIKNKYDEFRSGLISEEEAKQTVLDELRNFRYGNNDYVWVADINGVFLSHPDPEMNKSDFSEVRDVFGNYVLMPLIDKVMEKNEGYYSYWWQRLGQDLPAEQLTYARLFPQWGWIIGTGVYLDDLETEVIIRREKMVEELREILEPITIAKTGYMFVFDSWQNIIIHPDEELVNTSMSNMINPVTGKPLAEDIMAASKSDGHELRYKWNRENDKANFIYDKIAWVKYVEGFDWYIVASVYTDELNTSSVTLRNNILIVSAVVFILSLLIVVMLMSRLLNPIRKLSATAGKVEEGDLTAKCKVKSRDEIGYLATAFNSMVAQLKSHIEQLDQKVLERTKELDEKNIRLEREVTERKRMQEEVSLANKKLTAWVDKLEQHNREVSLLNTMGEMLQASDSLEDTYAVANKTVSGLFPNAAGALYMLAKRSNVMKIKAKWGKYPEDIPEFGPDDCHGLRKGKIHILESADGAEKCRHVVCEDPCISLCVPLVGKDEILGMLHLQYTDLTTNIPGEQIQNILEERKRLATAVADHLAMAQANLKLREKLHHLSVRDGLTGLFNRRYMEETLRREFKKAERNHSTTGVIMLDVDFFKKFNDTYGHEAGDVVLIELGKTLRSKVREEDVVCRYGGEEFVIIMPDSNLEHTAERAEEARRAVEEDLHINFHGQEFKVTISVGVAEYPHHGESVDQVLNAADACLYKAKEAGRNQVVAAAA